MVASWRRLEAQGCSTRLDIEHLAGRRRGLEHGVQLLFDKDEGDQAVGIEDVEGKWRAQRRKCVAGFLQKRGNLEISYAQPLLAAVSGEKMK